VTKLLFTFSAKIQRYPVEFTFIEIYDRVTGQHDRQWKILSGQIAILGGHCPLTDRYFQPWLAGFQKITHFVRHNALQKEYWS